MNEVNEASPVERVVKWLKDELETSKGAFCVIAYASAIFVAVCIMQFSIAT